MNIENFIESKFLELNEDITDNKYDDLYKTIKNQKLKFIFSVIHYKLISVFKSMNSRLPTKDNTSYFWADSSRELIWLINIIDELERELSNTEFSFTIDPYYKNIFNECNKFLKQSFGSTIPIGFNKITLYYTIPIFISSNTINTNIDNRNFTYSLKLIGEGSYAKVYKYNDTFYNRSFILKSIKKESSVKEIERFKREFEVMAKLKSPYIVEVYRYNNDKNEYIMDFMDYTLKDYITKYNNQLVQSQRKNLILQILKAFSYIHSKKLLHRDISYTNVLLKKYDDVDVIKISDFGMVKIPSSLLTKTYTEFRGCFNDPVLAIKGFNAYSMCHEIYALTKVIFFVLTGKTNTDKFNNNFEKTFIQIGLNPDITKRFKDINEIQTYINKYYQQEG